MLKQDLIRIKQKMCQHIYTTTRRPDVVFFYVIFLCTKYDLLSKRCYNLGQLEFNGIHLLSVVVKSFKFPEGSHISFYYWVRCVFNSLVSIFATYY